MGPFPRCSDLPGDGRISRPSARNCANLWSPAQCYGWRREREHLCAPPRPHWRSGASGWRFWTLFLPSSNFRHSATAKYGAPDDVRRLVLKPRTPSFHRLYPRHVALPSMRTSPAFPPTPEIAAEIAARIATQKQNSGFQLNLKSTVRKICSVRDHTDIG